MTPVPPMAFTRFPTEKIDRPSLWQPTFVCRGPRRDTIRSLFVRSRR